jgi:hypothetical protein
MKELKDLAYIITRYQVQEVNVITNPARKVAKSDSRYWEVFVGVRDNRWKTDEEMAVHFKMDPKSKAFNRLKNETKERLLNTIFFINMENAEFSEYARQQHRLHKEWAQAKTLLMRGANDIFIDRAWKCLKLAIEIEDVATIVDAARHLCKLIVLRPQYHKDHEELLDIVQRYARVLKAEIKIQLEYEKLTKDLMIKKGYKMTYAAQAAEVITAFEKKAARFPQVGFQIYYILLKVYHSALLHDWKSVVQITDEAIVFFQSKKYPVLSYVASMLNPKIGALIMLGQYEEATVCINNSLSFCIEGTVRWFKCKELSVVKDLYAGTYRVAWETVKEILKHERLNTISIVDQETWRLYQGYLRLLVQRGIIPLSAEEKKALGKFKMQAWLNDLLLVTQDKRGSNIPVIILQVHFLVLEKRFDELDARVEAIAKYRQRNLDPQSEHYRTDLMIDLLKLLPKYSHDIPVLQQLATPILEDMSKVSADISDRTFEIEPVPYERQWAWLLEELLEEPEKI